MTKCDRKIVSILFGLSLSSTPASSFADLLVIPVGSKNTAWNVAGDDISNKNKGNVGIGTSSPGQKLHLSDGNLLIEGGGETAIQIKRDIIFEDAHHYASPFTNPIFTIGRIIQGGDGAPQFRWMYEGDGDMEHVVMELDSEGIMSSVRRTNKRGSHFEGHLASDAHPLFRLNSAPDMQLQMGPGGSEDTDVALARTGNNKIAIKTNDEIRLTVDEDGDVGIGTGAPSSKLAVVGLPSGVNDSVADGKLTGALCITDTGNLYIDTDGICSN